MNRALLAIALILLAAPVTANAAVQVQQLNGDDPPTDLVSFSSATCKKGTGKKPILRFLATARKGGYELRVNYFKRVTSNRTITYGGKGGVDVTLDTPNGQFSNLNPPPDSPPAGGAIAFNAKRTRIGLGFSPMFNEGADSAVALAGGLTCKYPKPKRKKKG